MGLRKGVITRAGRLQEWSQGELRQYAFRKSKRENNLEK